MRIVYWRGAIRNEEIDGQLDARSKRRVEGKSRNFPKEKLKSASGLADWRRHRRVL